MPQAKIGVIGGTGLYQMEGFTALRQVHVKTPYGDPSDGIVIGELNGVSMAFLPRHGVGHRISPSELPSRANIFALKSLGVERIVAINSCGSFKEEIKPGDLVIPDQIIDRTHGRPSTFFGHGLVVHIPFAEPFCPDVNSVLYNTAVEAGLRVHKGGTFIAMEGPAFSTAAESRLHKSWGADIIGMTVLPEAKLAREAEICYSSICCVTDYDSWRPKGAGEPVTAETILAVMRENISNAKRIIKTAVTRFPGERKCECATALATAIVTDSAYIPKQFKKDLSLLIGKYVR